MGKVTDYREPPSPKSVVGVKSKDELVRDNTNLIEALHNEREAHGDTCVTLGMICEALGFDIAKSDDALPAIQKLIAEKTAAEKALVLIGEKAVVDFDDPTVGQVDAVVKNRETYKDWLGKVLGVYEKHEAEVARLKAWVDDLLSGKFVNCVYCGHRYGPEKDTPVSMADVLRRHIANCPEHPMSIVTKALSSLVEAKRLKEASGKTPEYERAKEAAWKLAEEALAKVGPK